jgi:hypothetical protein
VRGVERESKQVEKGCLWKEARRAAEPPSASKQTVKVSHKWGSTNRENRGAASRGLIDKLRPDIRETGLYFREIQFTDYRYTGIRRHFRTLSL